MRVWAISKPERAPRKSKPETMFARRRLAIVFSAVRAISAATPRTRATWKATARTFRLRKNDAERSRQAEDAIAFVSTAAGIVARRRLPAAPSELRPARR